MGMRWGHRSSDHPGASPRVNKEASKDAAEFARAKVFYGEGAGTRRKLIKATVESKSKKDPTYKPAFDHHLNRQDVQKHVEKAKGERRRKDVVSGVGKQTRAVNRLVNGPFAAPVLATVGVAAAGVALKTSAGQNAVRAGQQFVSSLFR